MEFWFSIKYTKVYWLLYFLLSFSRFSFKSWLSFFTNGPMIIFHIIHGYTCVLNQLLIVCIRPIRQVEKCEWLRYMTHHVNVSYKLSSIEDSPTILYKDNATCIRQLKGSYIKGDKIKHIFPNFFAELQKPSDIILEISLLKIKHSFLISWFNPSFIVSYKWSQTLFHH